MEWIIPLWSVLFVFIATVSCYSLHLSIQSRIEVRALQNSTHAVHMVPIPTDAAADDEAEKVLNQKIRRAEADAYDDLADMQEAANLPL